MVIRQPLLACTSHGLAEDAIREPRIKPEVSIDSGKDLQRRPQRPKLLQFVRDFGIRPQELLNPNALVSRQGIIQIPAQQLVQ
jgi:hypothetical protein